MSQILNNINTRNFQTNKNANEIWQAAQPELDYLRNKIWQTFLNTRATDANVEGIETWERIYEFMPNFALDTIDDRRERILEWKRTIEPFTEPWLNTELFRRTNSDAITAHIEGLTLSIQIEAPFGAAGEAFIKSRTVRELIPWLRGVIPANVFLRLHQTSLPESYSTKKYFTGFTVDKISATYVSSREVSTTALTFAARAYIERIEVEYYG